MSISDDKILMSFVISKSDKSLLEDLSKKLDSSVSSLIRRSVKHLLSKYSSVIDKKEALLFFNKSLYNEEQKNEENLSQDLNILENFCSKEQLLQSIIDQVVK